MFTVGDQVRYSATFLKTVGISLGEQGWPQVGKVVETNGKSYVRVHWHGEDRPRLVAISNLAKAKLAY